ncbi:fucolectin-like [Engraulis encrasicolus]|uniref:fucolectin-like n=1 Tax=Engraulis encrasicolus TaxID=184585 RepID=UPI002FD51F8C
MSISSTGRNVALYGRATQSNLIDNPWSGYSDAHNAIDGNRDSHFHHGSCSSTNTQTNPWWRVDLLKEYIITSVVITNRGDCCSERLDGAEIHIGSSLLENGNRNPLAGVISSIPAGRFQTFTLTENNVGRYVNVLLPGEKRLLTLCEVEVYGYRKEYENAALRGVATQSSLNGHGFAINAIDGNRDGRWERGSCSHTARVSGGTQTFDCNGMIGRHVTVVIPGRAEYLSLCEVEVSGFPLE